MSETHKQQTGFEALALIPENIVEAAAAIWLRDHDGDDTSDGVRMVVRERMKEALELVVPSMMAHAWLEGRNSYPDEQARNPYWGDNDKGRG